MKIQEIISKVKAFNPTVPYQIKDANALTVSEDSGTEELHTARQLVASWRDGLLSKQRMNKRHSTRPIYPTARRASVIELLAGLYDALAAVLVSRNAL